MNHSIIFFNRCFDKKRLKDFILWFFGKYGEKETVHLIENLKNIGFHYATKAGVSIGIDDLMIPFIKSNYINLTEQKILGTNINYQKGDITEIEQRQSFIDEWSLVSEKLKTHVIQFFKAKDIFNPIYMMAFSGARGNISQVRQLVGMRGLMADPQGQILDFPIRSNFREGLTLTEYLVSCYGARKGVVDTALRTATSGYLTRRLVDATQQVIIGRQNCYTNLGIQFTDLKDGSKTLLSLKDRIAGRVLLDDLFLTDPLTKEKFKIGSKDQEITPQLAVRICSTSSRVLLRSPLTCRSKDSVCQLCYGWNLAYHSIVSIGEAVGVLAAQSIGEPGTQLTMRTFHTGGVFTGGLIDQIYAPFNGEVNYLNNFKGVLIRTSKGRVGFLTKSEGSLQVKARSLNDTNKGNSNDKTDMDKLFFSSQLKVDSINRNKILIFLQKISSIEKTFKEIENRSLPSLVFKIPIHTILIRRHSGMVFEKELIAEISPISQLEDRSQEKEQEVLAPNTGQIFFDNLVLIEKVKREGSVQKVTYGLGSLWVVSANYLPLTIHPQIFPFQGDLISNYSMVQKLKILMVKCYQFDNVLSESVNNWRNLRANIYLTNDELEPYIKQSQIDKIFLTRDFHSSNFQKIYYQNLHYFTSISYQDNFSKSHPYSQITSLSVHEKLVKNRQYNFALTVILLGLKFSFQNNLISTLKKQKFRSNSLFYILQNEKTQKKINSFFSVLLAKLPLKSKLKHPIFTRKVSELQNQFSGAKSYQYWVGDYYSQNISMRNLESWAFSMKNPTLSSDSILPKNDRFRFLPRYSVKIKKIKTQQKLAKLLKLRLYKVSKFFFVVLNSKIESLNFSYTKILETLDHYRWISTGQLNIALVNRQSFTNIQVSEFWYLSRYEDAPYPLFRIDPKKRGFKIDKSIDNLPYIPHFYLRDFYTINLMVRPILINPSLFTSIYEKKFYRYSYLIQSYLISFYYEKLSNLKGDKYFFRSENKKIGFQTQFRLSTILNLNTHLVDHKLKQLFLEFGGLNFSKDNSILPTYSNIKQDYLGWPYLFKNINFLEEVGYRLNLGEGFQRETFFDRQKMSVDSINGKFLCKFRLLSFFSYRGFYALKIRFPVHAFFEKEWIVFQKVESRVNRNNHYSKVLSLNSTNKKRQYHNSLTFNFLNSSLNNFTRSPFNSKTVSNSDRLYIEDNLFDYNLFFFHRRVFLRSAFLQTLEVKTKTSMNLVRPFRLKSYIPLREGESETFRSDKSTKQNKPFCFTFNYLIEMEFASKTFSLNSVKELDIQSLISKNTKSTNKIKLFYKSFKYFSNRDSIDIELFSPYIDGEIVYKNSIVQKFEKDFVILTRSNLASFIISDQNIVSDLNALMLDNFLRYGTKFEKNRVISKGGQVIYIDKTSFTIQEATPFLITSSSLIHVHHDEIVGKGSRLFTFLSHRAKTGDIIQGIPKIEEFFEARLTRDGIPLITNLHIRTKQLFQTYSSQLPISEATQKSFEKVQYMIIDEIQKVYCSQGVYIADKHLEIVVRQMTSKVQIIKGGQTGFLTGELVNFNWVKLIEQKFGNKGILYEPVILGITKSCLETDSFISAASFQETTRILSKAAIQDKIDFIRGLKQNVILGNLIPAGTGFFSPLYFKYSKEGAILKNQEENS